jgi:hypothetical protein
LYALRILAENEGMEKAQVMRQFNGYVCWDALRVEVNKDLWLYIREF